MSKYLYERNSKWTTEENRQEYVNIPLKVDQQDDQSRPC